MKINMAASANEIFWQMNKNLAERNRHMLENELVTDVTFNVSATPEDEPVMVRAHKYMLVSASPVFWSMFCGELKEYGNIIVCNIEPEAFKEMLRFIYTEKINLSGHNVMHVLNAAKKYQLPSLAKVCTEFLDEQLDASNACSVLDHCIFFNEEVLKKKCTDIIERNTEEAFKSDAFLEISQSTLATLLDLETLAMKEIDLFARSLQWAKRHEKQHDALRETLGEAIFKIRFPTMTAEEFTNGVCDQNVLDSKEELEILKYITSQGTKSKPNQFSCKPRKISASIKEEKNINVGCRVKCLSVSLHQALRGVQVGDVGTVVYMNMDTGDCKISINLGYTIFHVDNIALCE